ncbi:uncharacterized protein CANTADRAFT_19444 [Suhomyces tanzawaensis NRRL Y-17324]|uniref:Exocyst complex component EXO84 n=1 Tax=Suhomyces tanzawaensis NRRL Y-17324 TaxID=984487 RepID=A0A1E4SQR4_9ASCO|nr:uncharacterized protein CANTADRAFT_19444 [Suhomyces tanzawaensis NRRL Y-17324]ODV81835.1 hypothetical protein CANTADRAFT_19444 [Suhomyces tanzawaensis NRRL Y-17324]
MDYKKTHRQSRAPWLHGGPTKTHNPYANSQQTAPGQDHDLNLLLLPNPYGAIAAPGATSRKNTRRLSIHASASAQQHGRSFSLTTGFDISNLPPVPHLHKTTTNASDLALVDEKDEFANIEAKIFRDLSQGTASEIDDYYKLLVKQNTVITRDIKSNINQNQKNILQLTNDLKETQEELLQLRVSTKELYEVLDDFRESAQRRLDLESPDASSQQKAQALKKKRDRSSILVLEKMWANELQSLFKHVEGASKYIQPLPGRHVIAESGRWQEINAGTWKPIKPTHLFILNDLLLMATKKSAHEGGPSTKSRLQAVQCLPLSQVELIQIQPPSAKSDDNKSYLINIKSKSLSYVYQTDRFDHFLKITEAYNKGRNELVQQERLMKVGKTAQADSVDTNDEKRQLRESYRNSGSMEPIDDTGKRSSGNWRNSGDGVLQDISARVHSRNRSHDYGKKKIVNDKGHFFNDLKNLEDKLDDVDVEIAHNQYDQAVGFLGHIEGKLKSIESAITNNSANNTKASSEEVKLLIDVIKLKINNRKVKVQQGLIFDLQHKIAKLTEDEIESIIVYFESFNQLEKGISSYLSAMSNHLSTTVTRLIVGVQGSTKIDVVNYLSNLVVVNISVIKRAVLVYNRKITPIMKKNGNDKVDSSGLINWCVDEITKLVAQLKKHLFGTLLSSVGTNPDTDQPILKVKDKVLFQDFLDVIIPQLDELKTVGVNVDFVFEEILVLQENEE